MNKEKSFLGEFTFTNIGVTCAIEPKVDRQSGETSDHLLVKENKNNLIRMGYVPGDGLKVINTKRRKNNPLGEFLGIKNNDILAIKKYMEDYGAFYAPLDSNYNYLNTTEIFIIQERLQAFINLLNNQVTRNINYLELLNSVLFLMLKKYDSYNVSDSIYLESESYFQNLISQPNRLDTHHNTLRTSNFDNQKIPYFERESTTLKTKIKMDLSDIQEIYSDISTPNCCKDLIGLFYSLDNLKISESEKKKIDFLFSYIYITEPFDFNIIDLNNPIRINVDDNLDFKNSLIEISKLLIKEEFERCLSDIKFTYNTETMSPDWQLPSLIAALYFSIFYKNSKNIIYRVCANINCNQYFQVSRTNSTKKHCSDGCRENKNARNLRARKKQGL